MLHQFSAALACLPLGDGIMRGMELDQMLDRLACEPKSPCDLAKVALQLAQDEYPDLDVPAYIAQLDDWGQAVRAQLQGSLLDKIAVLTNFLFNELNLRGNDTAYYDAQNSYLNRVFDRRLGIPISLSIMTIAIGRRAGLSVRGVGLPGHFIVKVVEGRQTVLFDPFDEGKILKRSECEELVAKVTGAEFVATPKSLGAASAGTIIRRMLTNLKAAYLRTEDFPRAARISTRLLQLDPANALEQRDLGVCLFRAGKPGRAIDCLERYASAVPAAADAGHIRQMLTLARREIARWN